MADGLAANSSTTSGARPEPPERAAARAILKALVDRLGTRATLKLLQDADHSFRVPVRAGRRDAEVRAEMLDGLASWLESVV